MIRPTLFALLLGTTLQAATVREIPPAVTDPEIDIHLDVHLAAIDTAAADVDVLYVHLVGSCGNPINNRIIAEHVADLGLHVVSLSHPNCPAVFSLAQQSSDPDVHEQVRRERIYGDDLSPLVEVNRANSIENRLIKLLEYLDAQFPSENWGQYLAAGSPNWSSIIVGGHSQGSGHAGLLAKDHELRGAVLFGGPGDGFADGELAPWIFLPQATPAERIVGFTHRADSVFNRAANTYIEFGMDALAPGINVDGFEPPYRDSQRLTSLLPPVKDGGAHGSVVVDHQLAFDANGIPIYAPVWTQMFNTILVSPSERAADTNCDGQASVGDIGSFVLALTDGLSYVDQFTNCNIRRADVNGDGFLTVGDIGAFVAKVTGG